MSITLSSVPQVLARIGTAHDVDLGAYFLPSGEMRDALDAAARRGAHVAVSLQRNPYPATQLERVNASAARELRDAGAEVRLFDRDVVRFHCKAAVCDGVAYLDDRNWARSGGEVVLADDDPRDVAALRAALDGPTTAPAAANTAQTQPSSALTTTKAAALKAEADLIDAAPDAPAVVATEALGACAVTAALRRHAAHGAPTTLLVTRAEVHGSVREQKLIAGLRRDGVTVRETGATEKFALVGDRAWIGSANASSTYGPEGAQVEWGLVTDAKPVVDAVRATLTRHDGG